MHRKLELNQFQRIFTDVDLYDSAFFQRIVLHTSIIETFIARYDIQIPEGTDLVLDINLDTNSTYVTDYYFANHQLRTIFFLDHFTSECMPNWEEIKGVSSPRHLRTSSSCYWFLNGPFSFRVFLHPPEYEMEAQYWCEPSTLIIKVPDCFWIPWS